MDKVPSSEPFTGVPQPWIIAGCCQPGAFLVIPKIIYARDHNLAYPLIVCDHNWQQWLEAESQRTEQRLDAIAIVTPNFLHAEQAIAAMKAGFDVCCEKPLAVSLTEGDQIQQVMNDTGRQLILAHTYAGYPMVQQARQLVAAGELGSIRRVDITYHQGWLSDPIERPGPEQVRQAVWRCDPEQSGPGGCLGDIGTHAAHLAMFISGQYISSVAADVCTAVPGRALDDDFSSMIRFDQGAKGTLSCSQVCAGLANDLSIVVGGSREVSNGARKCLINYASMTLMVHREF